MLNPKFTRWRALFIPQNFGNLQQTTLASTGDVTVSADQNAAIFSVGAVSVSAGCTVTPAALNATFAIQAPTISAGGDVTVAAGLLTLSFAVVSPTTVSGTALIAAGANNATFGVLSPTIITNVQSQVFRSTLTLGTHLGL